MTKQLDEKQLNEISGGFRPGSDVPGTPDDPYPVDLPGFPRFPDLPNLPIEATGL